MFSHVKIKISKDSTQTTEHDIQCIQYPYVGSPKQAIPHPLILTAHATYNYFIQKPGFSIFSLLKNPMVLMMIFGIFLMLIMPSMMENLDPEQKEQMQRQMEMQSDPSKMLNQLWGDLSGSNEIAATEKKGGKVRRTKQN